jgi:hypothetical protein
MIKEASTFVAASEHKIIAESAILSKLFKRIVASMEKFTDIGALQAVADEPLFDRANVTFLV